MATVIIKGIVEFPFGRRERRVIRYLRLFVSSTARGVFDARGARALHAGAVFLARAAPVQFFACRDELCAPRHVRRGGVLVPRRATVRVLVDCLQTARARLRVRSSQTARESRYRLVVLFAFPLPHEFKG